MKVILTEGEIRRGVHEAMYWYGMKVPDAMIEVAFNKDPSIAGGFSEAHGFDTLERSYFSSALLEQMGIEEEWPCNGDDEAYKDAFYKKLREAAPNFGVEILF